MSKFVDEQRERLRKWTGYVQKNLDLEMPATVLAMSVFNLFTAALAVCGDELMRHFSRWMLAKIKIEGAFCPTENCDNTIMIAASHEPICEKCDHEAEEFSKKYGEEATDAQA